MKAAITKKEGAGRLTFQIHGTLRPSGSSLSHMLDAASATDTHCVCTAVDMLASLEGDGGLAFDSSQHAKIKMAADALIEDIHRCGWWHIPPASRFGQLRAMMP